ncbi:MAG: ABC transporter permease [Candidatus Micrarchaeota archaeon]
MFYFAFKNLWLKKTRTALALIGLSIAIVGLISLISLSAGIRYTITESISNMQGVTVIEKDAFESILSTVDEKYADDIEKFTEVNFVTPEIWGMIGSVEGQDTLAKGMASMLEYAGVDSHNAKKTISMGSYYENLKKGRFLTPSDKYSIVISQKISDDYKKSVGSKMSFAGEDFRVVGIYETGSQFLDMVILMPIDTAREIGNFKQGMVSLLYVDLKNPNEADRVASKIEFMIDDVDAKTSSERGQEMGSIVSNIDMFFLAISSVAIMVGAIGILNTMLMSVMERYREFGVLKAVGWTSDDVIKLVLYESLMLGIIGGVLGIALGYFAVFALDVILPFSPVLTLELVVSSFFLSIILGVVGGTYPAFRASKLDPVVAIRHE